VSWKSEVDEILRRKELAKQMGGAESVARHHGAGKLTARERIEKFLDPGSFREIGGLTGSAKYDEQGRLFVCELHGYNVEGYYDIQELNKTGKLDMEVRRIQASKEATERAEKETYGTVKLLLDTDRDGRMDQAIVWADHLPTCYGLVAANGGILVACAPDIVFLKDTDGDNRPDVRETLFTGFAVGELWRGINCPQSGVDNWIYFGAGWGGGNVTGPHLKTPVKLGRTDFRIKPDGSAIEPVEGQTGTFGHAMTDRKSVV